MLCVCVCVGARARVCAFAFAIATGSVEPKCVCVYVCVPARPRARLPTTLRAHVPARDARASASIGDVEAAIFESHEPPAHVPSARRVTLPSTRDEKAAIAKSRIGSPGWWMSGKRLRYRGELSEADGGRPLARYACKG